MRPPWLYLLGVGQFILCPISNLEMLQKFKKNLPAAPSFTFSDLRWIDFNTESYFFSQYQQYVSCQKKTL